MTADDMMMLAFVAYWLAKVAAIGVMALNADRRGRFRAFIRWLFAPTRDNRPRRRSLMIEQSDTHIPRIPFD